MSGILDDGDIGLIIVVKCLVVVKIRLVLVFLV